MKTVTICGSMKFAEEMKRIAFELELFHKMNVLQCVYDVEGIKITDNDKEILAEAHFQKIDMSDAIYVVDIGGYIGESVKSEMAYAKKNGKEVILHTEFRGVN